MEYQVSVIVVSYNPSLSKLLTTLQRIIDQKGVTLEIILCDDCSAKDDYFSEVEKLFAKNGFTSYGMHRNSVNQGIVKNFYGGILLAKGKYVFMASPGDYFYDENSLKNLYEFAEAKKAQICFGDAVYYYLTDKLNVVEGVSCGAYNVSVYDEDKDIRLQKLGTLFGNHPTGATVFREKNYAINYIGRVGKMCRYLEDLSARLSSFDGVRIYHYDGFILWYEYGSGLSTNSIGNRQMLGKDEQVLYDYMKIEYSNDPMLDFFNDDRCSNKIKRKILLLTKHARFYLMKKSIQLRGTRLKYRRNYDLSKFPTAAKISLRED